MRLSELEPQWLTKDGRRVGIIFRSPKPRTRSDGTVNPTPWRMTCFFEPLSHDEQYDAVLREIGIWGERWTQLCRDGFAWTCTPAVEQATFDNMSVQPSIDGGINSWHGFITNGEIR